MFWAVNKKTGEKINSLNLINNPKYQFPENETWIADWDEISNADEVKEKYSEIKVVYVSKKEIINFKGTKFFVSPHFRIPNASKLGINIVPESKEHRLAKDWIYNLLTNEVDLKLYYSTVNKPFRYINPISIKELPIDTSKIDTEVNIKHITTRRVDVTCPFIIKHPFLGNGIQFEIQFSRQRVLTRENRTFDAAYGGYSICWIGNEDIDLSDNAHIIIKKEALKIDSWASIIKYSNKEQIKRLKFTVQEEIRKIDKYLRYESENVINRNLKMIKEEVNKYCDEFKKDVSENYDGLSNKMSKVYSDLSELRSLKKELENYDGFCPRCRNKLIYKEGISKKGNAYKLYECMDTSCGFKKWA